MKRRTLLEGAGALALPVSSGLLWPTRVQAAPKVKIGLALPFTGVQAEIATDLRLGYELAFGHAEQNGLDIEPVWEDDKANADETARLMEKFSKDRSIIAASGIVGTPHAKAALPVAIKGGLPVVGLRSGAAELRDGSPLVFHLRASFSDELTLMLSTIKGAGLDRLAVVYSDDAFGKSSVEHVKVAATKLGMTIATAVAAERTGKDVTQAVDKAVDIQHKAGALLMLMIMSPMVKGVTHARNTKFFMNPVFCMSFCATRQLADSTDKSLAGLGLVSAFPLPRSSTSELAGRFRRLAEAAKRPEALRSLTAFEGFMYGSVLSAALSKVPDGQRTTLQTALRKPIDVGGVRVAFDAQNVGYHHLQVVRKSGSGEIKA